MLVAFTFSGAVARLEARRDLIVREANAIGTAYLRIDVLPGPAQPALREAFRQYLDTRLEVYRHPLDSPASKGALDRSHRLQSAIWSGAVEACRQGGQAVVVLPALNEMIDLTATRAMALRMHPPRTIYVMLCILTLVSALLAGHGLAGSSARNRLHTLGFAAIFAITVFVILDIEYPRQGLIRVDAADQVLVELRATMK